MERCITKLQKLWQIRATRVALLLIAAIFATVIINSRSSLSPLLIFEGLPRLSSNPVNPTNASPQISFHRSANDTKTTSEGDLVGGSDLEEDHATSDAEFEIELGNETVHTKYEDGYYIAAKAKGGQQSVPMNSSDEFTFTMGDVSNSSLHSDESDRPFNSSAHQFPSPPLHIAPFPVLPNVIVEDRPSKPKKDRQVSKTYYIPDMEQLLIHNRASSQSMTPRWPLPVDGQILHAKAQIKNAPIVTKDPDLYAPGFRNVSMFKRSYELMEQILKVYVYKEGDKPIFHKPPLIGVYASEGWFMKQMEENIRFAVNDPRKAHLFYMPFSPRMLEKALFNRTSHSKNKMIQNLRNYVRTISSKYPFWNRTGGADHFLAGCHDWATSLTAISMPTSIRAVCTADVHVGFEIGKDVSLPVTRVVYDDDPLSGLGGKPPRKRTLLAFFAGQMHGYLRPILLQYYGNDPAMKIIGTIPNTSKILKKKGNKTNNIYIDYMKDSKYCICPRGYEVNSPRIIEAIFYECVPVIISDNFVPPFFEILDWEAFSLILPESDVPRLKDILLSITQKRYEALQMGVRRIQKHFLWNKKPVKYDLFHMILHNVWLNRIYQLKVG